MRDAEVLHREHRDAGERLVDLPQIDIADRPAGLLEQFLDRADRGDGEFGRLAGVGGSGDDRRDRLIALGIGIGLARQDYRSSAVADRRAGGGGDRAVLRESGAEGGDLVGHAAAGRFIGVDDDVALAALDRDRRDFVLEPAAIDRCLGAAQRRQREIVHVLAGELVFVGGALRKAAHRAAFLIGIFEPVEEHMIVGGVMADARAAAMLLEQIGRVGHRFHAARDDQIGIARRERFGTHDHRLHARSADFVNRCRLDRFGQPGLDRSLARRGLAKPGGKHAAHVDAVDIAAVDASALDRCPNCGGAEVSGGGLGQAALHRAHRGAGGRKDDDRVGGHGDSPVMCCDRT